MKKISLLVLAGFLAVLFTAANVYACGGHGGSDKAADSELTES